MKNRMDSQDLCLLEMSQAKAQLSQGDGVPLKCPLTSIALLSNDGFPSTCFLCSYKELSIFLQGSSTNPK